MDMDYFIKMIIIVCSIVALLVLGLALDSILGLNPLPCNE